MTIWEGLLILGVFGVIVWWARNAVFDACEECNYDCKQGRECPYKDEMKPGGTD